jgi:hypothetical protein
MNMLNMVRWWGKDVLVKVGEMYICIFDIDIDHSILDTFVFFNNSIFF